MKKMISNASCRLADYRTLNFVDFFRKYIYSKNISNYLIFPKTFFRTLFKGLHSAHRRPGRLKFFFTTNLFLIIFTLNVDGQRNICIEPCIFIYDKVSFPIATSNYDTQENICFKSSSEYYSISCAPYTISIGKAIYPENNGLDKQMSPFFKVNRYDIVNLLAEVKNPNPGIEPDHKKEIFTIRNNVVNVGDKWYAGTYGQKYFSRFINIISSEPSSDKPYSQYIKRLNSHSHLR